VKNLLAVKNPFVRSSPSPASPPPVSPSSVTPPPVAAVARESSAQGDEEAADIAAAQGGDLEAFDRLVVRHQSRVFNLCLWVVGDHDEAADAAQDTFIRAYRHLRTFRGDSPFVGWLGRIAVNVARDAATKRKKAPRDFSELETPEGEFDPPANTPSVGDTLQAQERQQAVRRALALVPEHFRVVLVLFDLQGHSYEECATILNLPMGTVKSRLSRARAALREALRDDWELFSN
jgi:RNA polymerase sigma-70 factor, ECF subfamily